MAAAMVMGTVGSLPAASQAAVRSCGESLGYHICVTVPLAVLNGDQQVAVSVAGSAAGIFEMNFAWGPSPTSPDQLLSDFWPPYRFEWRTDQYLDATEFLNVRVKTDDVTAGAPVSLRLTLDNGNLASTPTNPHDWRSLFVPRPQAGDDVVIAAVGDGADGRPRSNAIAASIARSNASVFLYLGDVYERGTPAEWDANYGRASFEGEGGWDWGALARFTVPTLGNHEAHDVAAWRNYWHGRPNFASFTYQGMLFIDLNSECVIIDGACDVGSPQYRFVQRVLHHNDLPCIVAFWHRPVLGSADINSPEMRPIWALLSNNGGDLVLNGHVHDMEIYAPLNAGLEAGRADSHMVEIVSGSGGHNLLPILNDDPRNVWQAIRRTGALYITAIAHGGGPTSRLDWAFQNKNGKVISTAQGPGTGSIACGNAKVDREDTNP